MRLLSLGIALTSAVLLTASSSRAEVVSRSENAFTLTFTGSTALGPAGLPAAMADVSQWWDPEHSYTGDAANLSLDLTPGGCWCEAMPDGTAFDHGRTVSVVFGEMRFHAPFGPLRSVATRADLIVTYTVADRRVTPTWTFIVEGPGVGAMADPVDGVMGNGFARWIAYMDQRFANSA